MQLRHVLPVLLQSPFHRSPWRKNGRTLLPGEPGAEGGQGLLQEYQAGRREGVDRDGPRQRLEHRQGFLGSAELRSQRDGGAENRSERHYWAAVSLPVAEIRCGYARLHLERG